jgi:hypothetical protein
MIRLRREYACVMAGSGVLVVPNIEHSFLHIPLPRVGASVHDFAVTCCCKRLHL